MKPGRQTTRLAAFAGGCAIAIAAIVHAALWHGFSPGCFGSWAYIMVVAAVLLAVAFRNRARFWVAAAVLAIGPLLGVLSWAYANVGRVAQAAEALASGRRYCLQVPSENQRGYRAVATRRELNGVTMQAPSGEPAFVHWAFHAVLVVENTGGQSELYNWSYRAGSFRPIKDSTRKSLDPPLYPLCTPQPDFAKKLRAF